MWTAGFWAATGERMVRTFAQSLLAVLGAGSVGILNAPWGAALSTAAMAAVLALLTAVATPGGPGFTEHTRGGRDTP